MRRLFTRGARELLARLGLRVSRAPANRFDAMGEALVALSRRGYAPRIVIDAGANRGQFARLARSVFPVAALHLVEPQSACAEHLLSLARADGRVAVHRVIVTEPGVSRATLVGVGAGGGSTGAFVPRPGESGEGEEACAATTLDALFAERVTAADRALLKLDLQGHEMPALAGAERLLRAVEAIACEVQFYDVERAGRARFFDVAAWLRERGFELHDLAALAARPRDGRLRSGDALFVRDDSPLAADRRWA